MTLRNEHASQTSLSPVTDSLSPADVGSPLSETDLELQHIDATEQSTAPADPLSCKDSAKDSESIISSGMSSLCNSPPLNSKRMSKYSDRYDAVTLKLLSSRLDESLRDAKSMNSGSGSLCLGRMGSRSVSASLTNVSGNWSIIQKQILHNIAYILGLLLASNKCGQHCHNTDNQQPEGVEGTAKS